jgi:hypothetical protein
MEGAIASRFHFLHVQQRSRQNHMGTAKKPPRAGPKGKPQEWNDSRAVDEFLKDLKHPLKPVVEAIRSATLSADPRITEGIKWNAPSFYCNGWFATANVRGKDSVMVVFHMGAKVKDNTTAGMSIDDKAGLLDWAAKERAVARFSSLEDFNAKRTVFKTIVSQWVSQMG